MGISGLARFVVGAALMIVPVSARAQFTPFTDFAAFLAATTGIQTDTFDGMDPNFSDATTTRSAGPIHYTVTGPNGLYVVAPGSTMSLTTNGTDTLSFTGFAPSIRVIGGFFFGTDFDGLTRPSTTLTFWVWDTADSATFQTSASTLTNFFGIVSTLPITSFAVSAEQPASGTNFAYATVDNLVLATDPLPTNVVPEPSTYLLTVSGVLGLLLSRRRRRE